MAKTDITINSALVAAFLEEADAGLLELDADLMELANEGERSRAIDAIFRTVHTIKGNSSFFGLLDIKRLGHDLESMLDYLRRGRLALTAEISEVLIAGMDELKAMVERVRNGDKQVADREAFDALLAQIAEASENAVVTVEEASAKAATATRLMLEEMVGADVIVHAPALEAHMNCVETELDTLDRLLEESMGILGKAAVPTEGDTEFFFNEIDVTAEVCGLLALLEMPAEGQPDIPDQIHELLEQLAGRLPGEASDPIQEMLDDFNIFSGSAAGYDELLREILTEKVTAFRVRLSEVRKDDDEDGLSDEQRDAMPMGKSLRVPERKVDEFVRYVGDLLISAESFSFLQKQLEASDADRKLVRQLAAVNSGFTELTDLLQHGVLEIRKVPVRETLGKAPRMARSLARQMSKKIEVVSDGLNVEIDKSLCELLADPLTHLIRNAMDHGIESPEARVEAGKQESGTLRVSARRDAEWVVVEIADDGAGIDPRIIRGKAVERGQITNVESRRLSDEQVLQLIFSAGFSTAREVTEVSGRGVGMDVVMTNIERAGGKVDVSSRLGEGTRVTLRLPATVTMEVIRGLVVAVGDQQFLLPLDSVQECLKPKREQVTRVGDGVAETLLVRGEVLPLVRLGRLLRVRDGVSEAWRGTAVLTASETGRRAALLVDSVLGQQQAVVKSLGPQFSSLHIVAGGAVMGDGRVGLVLDTAAILATNLGETRHA